MIRYLAAATLLALFTASPPTRAADTPAKADGPSIMVRLQSVDQILNNADYFAGLIGQEETAKQILGFVRALAGEKGLEGVDIKKPFVLYANLADELINSEAVLMAPIADKDSFLGLLKNRLNLTINDEKDGLYSVEAPNNAGTIYLRFANDYVYGTYLNKANVAVAKLPKPADVVGKGDAVLSLALRIDRIPAEMRKFALASVENELANAKQAPLPPEMQGQAIKDLRDKFIDSVSAGVKSVLFEGQEVNLKLDINSKTDELALEVEMSAVKGSDLAKEIAAIKTRKSLALGSLGSKNTAVLVALNASLPEGIKKVLGPAIDDIAAQGMKKIPPDALPIVGPVIKAFLPTLKAGDMDVGFAMLGPDATNKYTAVLVGKIASGKDLEKSIKEAVGKSPPMIQERIAIDADSVGDTKLHQIKVKDGLDEKAKAAIGESDAWLAFRDDLAIAAIGPNAKEAIKAALASQGATGPVFKTEFWVSRLLPAAEVADAKAAKDAAKVAFKKPDSDTFTLSVEGGESLRLRAALKGSVIKFAVLMDKAKGDKK